MALVLLVIGIAVMVLLAIVIWQFAPRISRKAWEEGKPGSIWFHDSQGNIVPEIQSSGSHRTRRLALGAGGAQRPSATGGSRRTYNARRVSDGQRTLLALRGERLK
jgi:hypothetical protein